MTESTPARDFLLPRLQAMLEDGSRQGISRDVAVAVLIDLVTGPGFNDVPLDPAEDAPGHGTGNEPISVRETAVAEAEAIPVGPAGLRGVPGRGGLGRYGDTILP